MSYEQDVVKLNAMIDELRRMRDKCEPKNRDNPRYHAYSMAVSSLNRVIDDMQAEDA